MFTLAIVDARRASRRLEPAALKKRLLALSVLALLLLLTPLVNGSATAATRSDQTIALSSTELVVAARGSDGEVRVRRQTNRDFGPWVSLGGMVEGEPVAFSWGTGHLAVFARSSNDHFLYVNNYSSASSVWGGWARLGNAPVADDVSVVSTEPGKATVFARDTSNQLAVLNFSSTWDTAWSHPAPGLIAGVPAGISWGNGHLAVLVRSGNNSGLYISTRAANGTWSVWGNPIGGQVLASDPSVVSPAANELVVAARGWTSSGSAALVTVSFKNGAWTPWAQLNGDIDGQPAVGTWGSGHAQIFARGRYDSQLYTWTRSSTWSSFQLVNTTPLVGSPHVASALAGHLSVISRVANDSFSQSEYRTSTNGWTPNRGIGSPDPIRSSGSSIALSSSELVFVKRVSTTGAVAVRRQTHRDLGPWVSLGGFVEGEPVAFSWGPGHLAVFARDANNHYLYVNNYSFTSDAWGGWAMLGDAPVADDVSVVSTEPGKVTVFARDTSNQLAVLNYNGSWDANWSHPAPGLIAGAPAGVSWGNGHLAVLVRSGNNNGLYISTRGSNGTWSDWGGSVGGQVLMSDPSVVSPAPGEIVVAARGWVNGAPDALVSVAFQNGAWTNWTRLDGQITRKPVIAAMDASAVSIFAPSALNGLPFTWYRNNQTWLTYQQVGNTVTSGAFSAASATAGHLSLSTENTSGSLIQSEYRSWDNGWGAERSLIPYISSFNYGGANFDVDNDGEVRRVIDDMRASSDAEAGDLYAGLSQNDRDDAWGVARHQWPSSVDFGGNNWHVDSAGEIEYFSGALDRAGSDRAAFFGNLSPDDQVALSYLRYGPAPAPAPSVADGNAQVEINDLPDVEDWEPASEAVGRARRKIKWNKRSVTVTVQPFCKPWFSSTRRACGGFYKQSMVYRYYPARDFVERLSGGDITVWWEGDTLSTLEHAFVPSVDDATPGTVVQDATVTVRHEAKMDRTYSYQVGAEASLLGLVGATTSGGVTFHVNSTINYSAQLKLRAFGDGGASYRFVYFRTKANCSAPLVRTPESTGTPGPPPPPGFYKNSIEKNVRCNA